MLVNDQVALLVPVPRVARFMSLATPRPATVVHVPLLVNPVAPLSSVRLRSVVAVLVGVGGTVVVLVALAESRRSNEASLPSLLRSAICPPKLPAVVALNRMVNVVDCPALRVKSPRLLVSEKPAGIAVELNPASESVPLPTLVTVNVLEMAAPTEVEPKLAVPPSVSSLPVNRTLISGDVLVTEDAAGGKVPRSVNWPA